MTTTPRGRLLRTALTAAALLGAGAPAAHASLPPNVIGLEVKAVDGGARSVTGVQHCVQPENAGVTRTFAVSLSDFHPGQFPIGAITGVEVDWSKEPPVITRFGPAPCNPKPHGTPPGGPPQAPWPAGGPQPGVSDIGQPGGPLPGQPGQPGQRPGEGDHKLDKKFLSRVWKFTGEADGYQAGALSITLEKVLNLPKSMAKEDDELVDEDALVLIGPATKVYSGTKAVSNRREAAVLADAEEVRVQGKMLPETKWREDEDGEPVTTIRAKKVYVLG